MAQGGRRGEYALVDTGAPLAANTAFGYLRVLKTFSRWLAAEEQAYTARDALAALKPPRRPKARKEPLSEGEMGHLLDGYNLRAPIANRDFAILLTYLGTGLRATELTNLLLDDVHVEEGYLRVRHGKGGKSRAVSLPPEVATALFRYRQHHRSKTGDTHFFVTRSGTPLTYNGIKCVLRRARGKSGIARLHTHLLRHSFSVAARRSGMDLMTFKETLGHEDIRTTTIYLSMSAAQLIEQQRKVNPIAGVALPKAVRKAKALRAYFGEVELMLREIRGFLDLAAARKRLDRAERGAGAAEALLAGRGPPPAPSATVQRGRLPESKQCVRRPSSAATSSSSTVSACGRKSNS